MRTYCRIDRRSLGPVRHGSHPYLFATLSARAIRQIVAKDAAQHRYSAADAAPSPGRQRLNGGARAIHRIWEDTEIQALITNSIVTVKADAACMQRSPRTAKDIVWAP